MYKRLRPIFASILLGAAVVSTPANADVLAEPNLRDISGWFNNIETMRASFQQYNMDGSLDTGTIYIKRPGRLRMEYDKQQSLLLVSGSAITIFDGKDDKHPQTYPLKQTPLWHFLKKDVDLGRPGAIKSFDKYRDLTRITAYDLDAPEAGRIVLEFENGDGTIKLAGWNLRTASGEKVLVRLRNPQYGMPLSNYLFMKDSTGSTGQR